MSNLKRGNEVPQGQPPNKKITRVVAPSNLSPASRLAMQRRRELYRLQQQEARQERERQQGADNAQNEDQKTGQNTVDQNTGVQPDHEPPQLLLPREPNQDEGGTGTSTSSSTRPEP